MMRRMFGVMIVIVCVFSLFAENPKQSNGNTSGKTLEKIVKKYDELYRSRSSKAAMEMTVTTPHWKRTMKMLVWTEGLDKTFVTILAPKKDRGISTLRIDNEVWNYFPKINKTMKIPPSMMMGKWMGSDFTNDDLVKETTRMDAYSYSFEKQNAEYYYLAFVPKKDTASVWGRIVTKIRKSDLLPVEETYYDEDGEKIRIMNFRDIRKMDGKSIPTVMELVPLNKKGHKTVVRYRKVDFNVKLDDEIFTLRNLRKKR